MTRLPPPAVALAVWGLLSWAAEPARSDEIPTIKPKLKFNLRYASSNPEVKVSADGRRAAIVRRGAVIEVWDLGPEPKMLSEFAGGSYCFALSPSGKFLLTTSKYEVYNVDTKKVVAGRVPSCSHAHFRDDDTLILTQMSHQSRIHTKGQVTTWDVPKNREVNSFEVPDNRFTDALLTRGGKELWLVMHHEKFEVERYDLDTRKLVRTVQLEPGDKEKAYTDSGLYNTATRDGAAFSSAISAISAYRVFDPLTGKIIAALPADLLGTEAGIHPVGNLFVAVGSAKGNRYGLEKTDFLLYDWKQEKAVAILKGHAPGKKQFNFTRRAASADGTTLVSVTEEGEVLVFDLSPVVKK